MTTHMRKEEFIIYLKASGLYEACGEYYLAQTTFVLKEHNTYFLFNKDEQVAVHVFRVC